MPATARLTTALGDRYVIERELGAGGMATVYLAKDVKHERDVALKVLRPELAAVLGAERFLNEIKITARLDHPHILTLIDSGAADSFLYYVLPFVRGESLRDRLTREKQLGLEEALAITRQVASALDYAHRQGVVHRDIKPENILIQEGEAMLADFGIALAVKEAGGNRLTETGLSLGTPQYMSPEQATGDRQLDARSDVYSLAAVLYEMLAGEPPVTGPTVQAVIAKLLTERPTRVRTVRDTVPEGIDNAVAKALAKVPADRFPSAGDFAAALAAAMRPSVAGRAAPSRPRWFMPVAAGALVVAIGGGLMLSRQLTRTRGPAYVLRDRTQATFSGEATNPTISADGKQLAYVVRRCERGTCTFGVEVQDIGGGASRRVFDGATALYGVNLSPDRLFVLLNGTIGNRYGSWILSALGGTPRLINAGPVEFFPASDSVLLASPPTDSIPRLWVAALDGERADSLVVGGRGDVASDAFVIPGDGAIVVRISGSGHDELRIIERSGRERDRLAFARTVAVDVSAVTAHAVWVLHRQSGSQQAMLVRLPLQEGRFGRAGDSLMAIPDRRIGVKVSADGGTIAYGDGTAEYGLWALDVADALSGRFPEQRRIASSTSALAGAMSPRGDRVLVLRPLPGGGRGFAVIPYGGGAEVTHRPAGEPLGFGWMADGAAFAYGEITGGHARLVTVDARTGARLGTLVTADSSVDDYADLGGGGWAWITTGGRGLRVQRTGESAPRDLPIPPNTGFIYGINGGNDSSLVSWGWDPTFDSIVVDVIDVRSGRAARWATLFSENGSVHRMTDGSYLLANAETPVTFALYRLRAPGRLERLGIIARPVTSVRPSMDARRVALVTRDFHGDVWLAHVAPAR